MYNIEFYERLNGKIPVKEFLNKLNTKMKTKALREIVLLREHGRDLKEPHVKYMKNGLFELRIKTGSDIALEYKNDYTGRY